MTEYNEAETMRRFERDGERRGETKLATLITKLFSLGRVDDAQKAASDEEARKGFFKEFNIV